jgi:hypothetical protein
MSGYPLLRLHSLLLTHYSLLEFMMSRYNTTDTKEYLKRINYQGDITPMTFSK